MGIALKASLAVVVALVLSLVGMTLYTKRVVSERDEAVGRAGALELAVDLAEAQQEERKQINDRLTTILKERRDRAYRLQEVADNLQEKINALSGTCTFSPDASRVLWEIYESRRGVQGSGTTGRPLTATDSNAKAPN